MRRIPLRKGQYPSSDIIRAIASKPSANRGINVEEMRVRLRILDAIEKAEAELRLEDADWVLLKNAIPDFEFGVVHPDLVMACDDILNAQPEAV